MELSRLHLKNKPLDPATEEDPPPTVVEVIRSNWIAYIVIYPILFYAFYEDGKDGFIDLKGIGMPVNEFIVYFIPLLIFIQFPYFALVYLYPRYIRNVKEELREGISSEQSDQTRERDEENVSE